MQLTVSLAMMRNLGNTQNPHTKSFGLYLSIRFHIRQLGLRFTRSDKQTPFSELARLQLLSLYERVLSKGGTYPKTGTQTEHSGQQTSASVDRMVGLSLSALEKASDRYTSYPSQLDTKMSWRPLLT